MNKCVARVIAVLGILSSFQAFAKADTVGKGADAKLFTLGGTLISNGGYGVINVCPTPESQRKEASCDYYASKNNWVIVDNATFPRHENGEILVDQIFFKAIPGLVNEPTSTAVASAQNAWMRLHDVAVFKNSLLVRGYLDYISNGETIIQVIRVDLNSPDSLVY